MCWDGVRHNDLCTPKQVSLIPQSTDKTMPVQPGCVIRHACWNPPKRLLKGRMPYSWQCTAWRVLKLPQAAFMAQCCVETCTVQGQNHTRLPKLSQPTTKPEKQENTCFTLWSALHECDQEDRLQLFSQLHTCSIVCARACTP